MGPREMEMWAGFLQEVAAHDAMNDAMNNALNN
jgi:hypothetical protein